MIIWCVREVFDNTYWYFRGGLCNKLTVSKWKWIWNVLDVHWQPFLYNQIRYSVIFFVFHGCIYRPKHALVPIVRDYLGYMTISTSKPYVTIMYCQGGSIHTEPYQSVAVPSIDLKTSCAMWAWKWYILSLHLFMIANHCNDLLSPVRILEVNNDNNPASSNIYFILS